ncbi:MAG TPA: RluA family pseudouridine synthase [Candidatus Binatia bacterium]|nr:RluA family pseudouridine synthase [Candidatus Binatia bacterium]
MTDQGTMDATKAWNVAPEHEQLRVDAFLRHCLPQLSRRQLASAIADRLVSLNGRVSKKGDRVSVGDVLVFHGPAAWLSPQTPANPKLQLRVVYEDSELLIIDKPAAMPTHGFSGRDQHTVANFIAAKHPELLAIGKSRWEPGILNRLDRDTSGLVLVAKTQRSFIALRKQFRHREIVKTYWALVWGKPSASGTITLPLAHDPRDKTRMRTVDPAHLQTERIWNASTHYRKLAQRIGVALLELQMMTGVTHQIRVHLAAIGYPIVGDLLYGAVNPESFGLNRQFLHAIKVQFRHPKTGRKLTVEAPLPDDLMKVLTRLKLSF